MIYKIQKQKLLNKWTNIKKYSISIYFSQSNWISLLNLNHFYFSSLHIYFGVTTEADGA